jgi:hypothetical protein
MIRFGPYKLVYHPFRTGSGVQIPGFKTAAAYQGAGAYHLRKIKVAAAESFY